MDSSTGENAPPLRRHHHWTVGRHLLAIAVAVTLVFLVLGAVLARNTWQDAERAVRADAGAVAEVAAENIAGHVEIAKSQLDAMAVNPAVAEVLSAPTECPLEFNLGLFEGSHLDLVHPDGRIACTSAELDAGTTDHGGADWLTQLAEDDGMFESRPFVDAVTGLSAVAFGVPIDGTDGARLGGVVVVAPTEPLPASLAATRGDRSEFSYVLLDRASGTVLAAPDGFEDRSYPMESAGFLFAERPVPGTSWVLRTGADPDEALAATRSGLGRGVLLGSAVLIVLLTALAIVNRRIAVPLRRLTDLVGDTGPHTADALGELRGPREIVRLGEEFQSAVEEREQYEAQLANVMLHDPITGLANRALLTERLELSLEHAERSGSEVGVAFVDLDRFKLINESLGHDVGDDVLISIGQRLQGLLRAGDTLARFGADEFVVIRARCDGIADLESLSEQVLDSVHEPLQAGETVVRVTASIGIAASTPQRRDVDLVSDAQAAMYLAKEQGRARVERFDPSLRTRASRRFVVETELQSAQERHELRVVYQPKVDLQTGIVIGVESLLRWDHPALGPVPPDTFIPIAEETGLMESMGRFVLDQSCAQAAAWRRGGFDVPVSVNVSGRQLTDAFAADVADVLSATGLPASSLCLEFTETLLMSDAARIAQLMHELHQVGVQLSIDDFGTGYSSLAYLHRFPFDELKIDRAFVRGLADLGEQRKLVEAMVAMSKALGLTVVAEGVETEEQASLLGVLGCDVGQGYLYARPTPPEDVDLPVASLSTPGV